MTSYGNEFIENAGDIAERIPVGTYTFGPQFYEGEGVSYQGHPGVVTALPVCADGPAGHIHVVFVDDTPSQFLNPYLLERRPVA